jgi:hypothetical protein
MISETTSRRPRKFERPWVAVQPRPHPQEIERWLRTNTKTAATSNRYKAFSPWPTAKGFATVRSKPTLLILSGIAASPRVDFDSFPRGIRLNSYNHREAISGAPVRVRGQHHSSMRMTEQYTCDWSQVHLDRRTIDLTKTKNGYSRIAKLNADSIAAIEFPRHAKVRPTDESFRVRSRRRRRVQSQTSTTGHGSLHVWRRRESSDISGTPTGTHSAHGWP